MYFKVSLAKYISIWKNRKENYSKYPLLNTFPFGGTEKKYTILKILNQKLPIFFDKLQHEMSSMFLLFLAAHQSSTRIARINNKKNKVFFMLSTNHKRKPF